MKIILLSIISLLGLGTGSYLIYQSSKLNNLLSRSLIGMAGFLFFYMVYIILSHPNG